MKFSDISEQDWAGLQPYMDTCLLPVTGLNGSEQPWEAVIALEKLRDLLDLVEIPFRGRIVTYPAMHYTDFTHVGDCVNRLCLQLRQAGFRFVVVIGFEAQLGALVLDNADLVLMGGNGEEQSFSPKIQSLWKNATGA